MQNRTLTSEKEDIINHPIGRHVRVLVVAGSGKTTYSYVLPSIQEDGGEILDELHSFIDVSKDLQKITESASK